MISGNRDMVTGAILLVLSIVLYFVIPNQVETLESDTLSPAFLPMLITSLIGVLSAFLLYQGFSKKKRNTDQQPVATENRQAPPSPTSDSEINGLTKYRNLIYSGLAIGIMIFYTTLIPWMGYILSTAVSLVCLALLFGNRNWKQILIMALVAPPAILLFFRYTLLVLLPQGIIFD